MTARIQNAGLARMTSALAGLSWFLGWGTGSGAAASASNVTTTGTTEARAAATATQQMTTVANDTLQLVATIVAGGAVAITELGAFDAAGTGTPPSGGNMDLYADFAVINLSASDSISFTLRVAYT